MRKKKICLLCGRVFIPHEKAQKYCSKRCAHEARLTNERERRMESRFRRKMTENMKMIAKINQEARERGMCYGQYVARYGANLSRENLNV